MGTVCPEMWQGCDNLKLIVCNAGRGRVDQFILEKCFTGKKTVTKSQKPAGMIATQDGHIFFFRL